MPFWLIHHSPNVLSPTEKQTLAKQLTQLYVSYGLPAFYVQVHFIEMPPSTFFIGGEERDHVTLTVYHLARTMGSKTQIQRFLADVDGILTPTFKPKGVDWEYFVTETERNLWKINGLVPPKPGSEGEKEWVRLNKAIKL